MTAKDVEGYFVWRKINGRVSNCKIVLRHYCPMPESKKLWAATELQKHELTRAEWEDMSLDELALKYPLTESTLAAASA